MSKIIKKDILQNFKVIIDSREQTPWRFAGSIVQGLPAGDYTVGVDLDGKLIKFDKVIAIERKSAVSELYSACGQGRERFENELEKLTKLQYKYIICEFNFMDLLNDMPPGKVEPTSVYGSVCSWQIKYNIPFFFAGNRVNARGVCWKLLYFFVEYQFLGDK